MNRAFIQFYSKIQNSHPRYKINIYELCNGFSDTLDFCKNHGDVIWIEHLLQEGTIGKSNITDYKEFPLQADEVYISAYYISQLYQTVLWAKENPNSKFIVGGPVALPKMFVLNGILPSNLIITDKSVEEYFKIPNFSYQWNLEIPQTDSEEYTLAFTYTVDTFCYWNKCIFCNHSNSQRKRESLNFDNFPSFPRNQRISIYSPSHTSDSLVRIIPKLPYFKNKRYDLFLRATNKEREALKNYLTSIDLNKPQPNLKMTVGVEFPSERMLKYIRKGFSVTDIIKMIDILSNMENVLITLTFILGWNNLITEDLKNLEFFMNKMSKHKIVFSVNRLFAKPFTIVHDLYEPAEKRFYGPFYSGFYPKLNKEQETLNNEALEIIKKLATWTVYDYYTKK